MRTPILAALAGLATLAAADLQPRAARSQAPVVAAVQQRQTTSCDQYCTPIPSAYSTCSQETNNQAAALTQCLCTSTTLNLVASCLSCLTSQNIDASEKAALEQSANSILQGCAQAGYGVNVQTTNGQTTSTATVVVVVGPPTTTSNPYGLSIITPYILPTSTTRTYYPISQFSVVPSYPNSGANQLLAGAGALCLAALTAVIML